MTISTERLLLRQWRAADLAPFAALNADPEVMEFFPAPLSRAQSDALAARCMAGVEADGFGFWAVEAQASGDFVGMVGLNPTRPPLHFAPAVEVGWRLARPHWGQGLATEAARAALRHGFEERGLLEIISFTALPNLRSQAVMRRLGMSHGGELFDHPAVPVDSRLRRHCLYRLSIEDWRRQLHEVSQS